MSHLQSLKAAVGLHGVAQLLGFQAKALAYILYVKPPQSRYSSFQMAKRRGGVRLISVPAPDLKLLQRRLSDVLQVCMEEINQTSGRKDQLAHGFKRGHSIIDNATGHRKRRWVLNLDLEDFFGTINFGRVRGFFIKDRNFALPAATATILAQIACHENKLPQGSPCSPVISNLVGHVLNLHLCKLAFHNGCTYSRYADDITFSTNKPQFPPDIAIRIDGEPHKWKVGDLVQRVVTYADFKINPQKTRMQYRNSRQEVTGLVVNAKVNIRSEYRRRVRAMAHRLFMTGTFNLIKVMPNANLVLTPSTQPGNTNQLHGMFGHIERVDRYNADLHRDQEDAETILSGNSKENLYRRFLMFKEFYMASAPVIICEGKTDNIYLSHAIKKLAANFPRLAAVSPQQKVTLKVRIFKYPETSTGRILQLHGGANAFQNFIRNYREEIQRFKAPGMSNPVVILVDNDEAGRKVLNFVSSLTKKKLVNTERFVPVLGNLYLVLTPLKNGNQTSVIEDSFTQDMLNLTIKNKTFNPENKFDSTQHFGKAVFADHVDSHAGTIDFSGFAEILERITAVLEAHANRNAQPQPVVHP